jgi:hypothetical protein
MRRGPTLYAQTKTDADMHIYIDSTHTHTHSGYDRTRDSSIHRRNNIRTKQKKEPHIRDRGR